MTTISALIRLIHSLAQQLPMTWFAFIFNFLEELFPPIPLILAMGIAGSILADQEVNLLVVLLVTIAGAAGKTIASGLVYMLGDKGEDFVTGKLGKILGVTHQDIEKFGQRFGQGSRDDLVIFVLRAMPFIPHTPVSLGAGIIKLPFKTFMIMTFMGNLVRNAFFLSLGYIGLEVIIKTWHLN